MSRTVDLLLRVRVEHPDDGIDPDAFARDIAQDLADQLNTWVTNDDEELAAVSPVEFSTRPVDLAAFDAAS